MSTTSSTYSTVSNYQTGVSSSGGVTNNSFSYMAATGNVIVGFDINSGCGVDGFSAVYTVPASNLSATPTKSVLNPAFIGDSDSVGYTGAGGEGVITGGSLQTLMAPVGSYINSMTVVTTNPGAIQGVSVGYLSFGYINPTTGATGSLSTSSIANGCGWWSAANTPYTYAGATSTAALVGFNCYSSTYFGGFTQVSFFDYVTQASDAANAAAAAQQSAASGAATTVTTTDTGGTAVATTSTATTSNTMTYVYILIGLVVLAAIAAYYMKYHEKNQNVMYPPMQPSMQPMQPMSSTV